MSSIPAGVMGDASLRSALAHNRRQNGQHRRHVVQRHVPHVPDAKRLRLPLPVPAAEDVAAFFHRLADLLGIAHRLERADGGGSVRAVGYVPDEHLPAFYRGAELFCYPSLYEGFGLPVLEAMQSGTAVVTSGLSSLPEVGGDAVAYVDPLDVEDIRRALTELLSDPELRARYAARAVARAKLYSWQATARETLTALESVAR